MELRLSRALEVSGSFSREFAVVTGDRRGFFVLLMWRKGRLSFTFVARVARPRIVALSEFRLYGEWE